MVNLRATTHSLKKPKNPAPGQMLCRQGTIIESSLSRHVNRTDIGFLTILVPCAFRKGFYVQQKMMYNQQSQLEH